MKIEVNNEAGTREPKAFIDKYGQLILPNDNNRLNTVIGRTGKCKEGSREWPKLEADWYTPLYEGDVITITL